MPVLVSTPPGGTAVVSRGLPAPCCPHTQPAEMGLAISKVFTRLFGKKEMRILMVR